MKHVVTIGLGLGFAALLMSGTASAVTCGGSWGPAQNPKSASVTVTPSSACQGPTEGNTQPDGGPNTVTITLPGGPWVLLDKSDVFTDPSEGALGGSGFAGGLSGTWSIDLSKIVGGYNNFVLGLKPDGAVAYFLLSGLSGTWSINTTDGQYANSHAVLYGIIGDEPCCTTVPEPGSLALFGLGLLGMGLGRWRRKA